MTDLRLRVLSFLFLLHLLLASVNAQKVPKELAGEGAGNKAGVQARLSQKGVNYISTFLKDVLMEQVLGASPKNSEEVQVQLNGTKSKLTELTLSVLKEPAPLRTRTEAPRQALLEMPAISFECKAKLDTDGRAIFRAPASTLWLNVSAMRHAQGAPIFRIEKCQLRAEKPMTVSIEGMSEQSVRRTMEAELAEAGPALMEQVICSRVVFILEERVNRRFSLLPSKLSLGQLDGTFIVDELLRRVGARRQRRADDGASSESSAAVAPSAGNGPDTELFVSFNVSRADSLLLDYTIVDIRADQRGIEVDSSGEVSIRGRGGTPFGPVSVALPEQANEEQMLQMIVSDFMPNSLLYHGHSVGLFNARVDPGTPHFGPIMRTSCPPSSGLLFCLGDFFPTLRRVHPDRALALLFSTVQPPMVKFRPQSAGGISFSLLGRIVISLLPPGHDGKNHSANHQHNNNGAKANEVEVAKMEMGVDAHMRIRLSATTVRPKVTLDKIALKTLTPGVLTQEELDKSVLLAREVLQRMVNEILRGGIPIPVHPLLRLHKPKVKVLDRALLLLTNVEFNERLVRQITSANLDSRGVR